MGLTGLINGVMEFNAGHFGSLYCTPSVIICCLQCTTSSVWNLSGDAKENREFTKSCVTFV